MHKELFILSLAYCLFNGEMGRNIKEKLYFCTRKQENNTIMSTATLSSLLEYLYGTLSPSNMRWVGEHLIEQAQKEEQREEVLTPYTREELLERAEEGRRQIAMGNYCTSEELFDALFEEFDINPEEVKAWDKELEESGLQLELEKAV